jgi:hypothetical protein
LALLLLLARHRQVICVKKDESGDDRSLLIHEILNHVAQHPDAKDSVDGIYSFWLSHGAGRRPSREMVREVLDYLVEEKGWLTRKVSGAAVTLYGLDKKYLAEVRNYLRGVAASRS